MRTDDSLCYSVAAQLVEVVDGCLRSGQNDDVRLFNVGSVVGIEQVDAFVALKHVEVGEV